MIYQFMIQCLGAVGYLILSLSYFKKEKRQILFMQIISYLFFALHYYFLSGITGTICNLLGLFSLLSIYLFEKYKLKNKLFISVLFILLIFIINMMTFQNIYSIFPMIASIIVIVSFFSNDENFIRKIGIVSAICWLIYAIVYKSYISLIFEFFTFINVITAFVKNRKK